MKPQNLNNTAEPLTCAWTKANQTKIYHLARTQPGPIPHFRVL